MTAFPLWAERMYNRPLALDRVRNDVLCDFARSRIFGIEAERITSTQLDRKPRAQVSETTFTGADGTRKPFRSKDGIAAIDIFGTLVQRGGWMDAESGLIGYDTVLRQLRAASADPEIRGLFVRYDTGGGEVAGMFAAAEEMAAMAKAEGGKPMFAYLDEFAASAGYVLASTADRIFARPEARGGSIAAIINIVDTSKAFEKAGLDAIIVRAEWADRKARPQPGEMIDQEAIDKFSALVTDTSNQIAEFVAAMRGTTEQAIRDLRGEFFGGTEMLKLGLIDEIGSERDAWNALRKEIAGN